MLLLHAKFQDTYFCCLMDPELRFLLRDGVIGWWNNSTRPALQDRHTNVNDLIFPFFGKAAIFLFLGVQVTETFYSVWQICLLLNALHGPCHASSTNLPQNMERRKNTAQVLPVVGPMREAAWDPSHQHQSRSPLHCGPCWSEEKMAFNSFRTF